MNAVELDKVAILATLNSKRPLSGSESFDIASWCSRRLSHTEDSIRADAREIVIRCLDIWANIPDSTRELWLGVVEAAGLYPYLLPCGAAEREIPPSLALSLELHRSDFLQDKYLHEEQALVIQRLIAGESVVLSAPTSFGKSLLIEEVVASKKYRNIVVIQPTLALLDETRKKLSKYAENYKIIVSTSQRPSDIKGNLFLFTGERVVEYKHWCGIDFFVIDEFYKLSIARDDERAVALNQALYKLLKMTKRFYLLGPSVSSISDDFAAKIPFKFLRTKFSTVALDDLPIPNGNNLPIEKKFQVLFDLLLSLKEEPTLVYCSSPQRAGELLNGYLRFRNNLGRIDGTKDKDAHALAEWARKYVHPEWSLAVGIEHRMAYHHGQLPRHIGSTLVDLFNRGVIRTLFCTSTLIEGVNTAAKNVVLFDSYKGNRKAIDFFDYRNIAGRSGRMLRYFTGRLYRFDPSPQQFELTVEIPLFAQRTAPPELLAQLEDDEIEPYAQDKVAILKGLDPALAELVKANGITIAGQLGIVKEITSNLDYYHELLAWRTFPSWKQMLAVSELGWKHLLQKGESRGNIATPRQLAMVARLYTTFKSFRPIIERNIDSKYWSERFPDEPTRREVVITQILGAGRHWFDYKLPKWLGTISSIQAYVFSRHNRTAGVRWTPIVRQRIG